MTCEVKIIEKKDQKKSSIKDLFKDLLNETKGFKVLSIRLLEKFC